MHPQFVESNVPPRPGPELYVRRVKAGVTMVFTVVSKNLWGLETHWGGKRSSPHLQDKGKCPGCRAGHPRRWKGYLHVYNETSHAQEIVELTPKMADDLIAQLGPGAPWRGARFNLKRGNGDKARCIVTVLVPFESFGKGPLKIEPRDPKPTLLELWGFQDVTLADSPETVIPLANVS